MKIFLIFIFIGLSFANDKCNSNFKYLDYQRRKIQEQIDPNYTMGDYDSLSLISAIHTLEDSMQAFDNGGIMYVGGFEEYKPSDIDDAATFENVSNMDAVQLPSPSAALDNLILELENGIEEKAVIGHFELANLQDLESTLLALHKKFKIEPHQLANLNQMIEELYIVRRDALLYDLKNKIARYEQLEDFSKYLLDENVSANFYMQMMKWTMQLNPAQVEDDYKVLQTLSHLASYLLESMGYFNRQASIDDLPGLNEFLKAIADKYFETMQDMMNKGDVFFLYGTWFNPNIRDQEIKNAFNKVDFSKILDEFQSGELSLFSREEALKYAQAFDFTDGQDFPDLFPLENRGIGSVDLSFQIRALAINNIDEELKYMIIQNISLMYRLDLALMKSSDEYVRKTAHERISNFFD